MNLASAYFLDRFTGDPHDGHWMHSFEHAIDALEASAFPLTHPCLWVVIQVRLQPHERGRTYDITVELTDEDGEIVFGRDERALEPLATKPEHHLPSLRPALLALIEPTFPRAGDYCLRVLVDGVEVGRVPLYVVASPQSYLRRSYAVRG